MTEVMRIYVDIQEDYVVESPKSRVHIYLFGGESRGDYFRGEILPGAVDTQRLGEGGITHLSARYCMKGVDLEGKECMVFVENEALSAPDGSVEMTSPEIYTDSEGLSWLETAELAGFMQQEKGQLVISIQAEITARHLLCLKS